MCVNLLAFISINILLVEILKLNSITIIAWRALNNFKNMILIIQTSISNALFEIFTKLIIIELVTLNLSLFLVQPFNKQGIQAIGTRNNMSCGNQNSAEWFVIYTSLNCVPYFYKYLPRKTALIGIFASPNSCYRLLIIRSTITCLSVCEWN